MRVDLFDFDLAPERIALRPANPRDSARLLKVDGRALSDHGIRDLPVLLRRGDILVFNDTKVLPAQLEGRRGTARIGATLYKREGPRAWRAFVRNARRLSDGDRVDFGAGVAARAGDKAGDGSVLLSFEGDDPVERLLELAGRMPLPPYIARRRAADDRDRSDYQTMFARAEGAVAAPTAALHFTPALMAALAEAGIGAETLTLHVGAGTFLPVKADDTEDHVMHAEWGRIAPDAADRLNAARAAGGRIIPVGTTSLRLLESAADAAGRVRTFEGETAIFITPGYRFRATDGLVTNFHLPRSTLFMLVSALMGTETMKAAYAHAIAQGYRFYSYGDASLLLPRDQEPACCYGRPMPANSIEGVPTSIAAFLGETRRGPFRPKLVTSLVDYQRHFGVRGPYLPDAVRGFFDNGGTRAFICRLRSGDDLGPALAALEAGVCRDVTLVAAPGLAAAEAVEAVVAHCEANRRFAVLDCARADPATLDTGADRASADAACYAPWLAVIDAGTGRTRYVPPSGHVLGVYARSDIVQGVWKAPANEAVRGAVDLDHHVDDAAQEAIAARGVNLIRSFPGRGIRVWGARTLSADPEWKYVSLRRLFLFLERSIVEGTQWVVFEPNDEPLWARVRDAVRLFLRQQWRAGALMGATEQQAFYVACGRTTMTQADIEGGRLVCEVGFAPLRPAEFVVFRIGQWTGEARDD